uniref:Uncharacterized protein n=1 Tax=Heliothis virescens TaxID=7102 RepID=A0A2A4IZU3_HELVI
MRDTRNDLKQEKHEHNEDTKEYKNLFTSDGLCPTFKDLEQIFDNSDDAASGDETLQVSTPPDSNKSEERCGVRGCPRAEELSKIRCKALGSPYPREPRGAEPARVRGVGPARVPASTVAPPPARVRGPRAARGTRLPADVSTCCWPHLLPTFFPRPQLRQRTLASQSALSLGNIRGADRTYRRASGMAAGGRVRRARRRSPRITSAQRQPHAAAAHPRRTLL